MEVGKIVKEKEMKNAIQLLEDYVKLVSEGDFEKVLELFAPDAIFEFPYFPSVGIGGRMDGRDAIRKQIAAFLEGIEGFKFKDVKLWPGADPNIAFGEYSVSAKVKSNGRIYNQLYGGRLEANNGKIKYLREFSNPIEAAIALFPNGVKDIPNNQK